MALAVHVILSAACVDLVERATPLGAGLDKVAMGADAYEVPVDSRWYAYLRDERRADESWSDVVSRLVRGAQRLRAQRAAAASERGPHTVVLSGGGRRR